MLQIDEKVLLFSSDRHDRGARFFYFLCRLKGRNMYEEGVLEKMQDKRKNLKQACGCMKEQGEDIAKELKFAAEYSADEMKDSWKHAGEAVRHAANESKRMCLR